MKIFKLFVMTTALLVAGVVQAFAGSLPVSIQITSNTSDSNYGEAYDATNVSWTAHCYTSVDLVGTATASVTIVDASLFRGYVSCTTPTYHATDSGSFSAIGNYICATCEVSASGTTSCWVYAGISCSW